MPSRVNAAPQTVKTEKTAKTAKTTNKFRPRCKGAVRDYGYRADAKVFFAVFTVVAGCGHSQIYSMGGGGTWLGG